MTEFPETRNCGCKISGRDMESDRDELLYVDSTECRFRAENERIRKAFVAVVNHFVYGFPAGDLRDAFRLHNKLTDNSTSAGSVARQGMGTDPETGVTPKAEVEDPPRCGRCVSDWGTHWFTTMYGTALLSSGDTHPSSNIVVFFPPPNSRENLPEWHKCPGPARKEGLQRPQSHHSPQKRC